MTIKVCKKGENMNNKINISIDGKKIKLLGDSITHGVGGTGFCQNGEPIAEGYRRSPDGFCWAKLFKEKAEKKYGCSVTNNGCTGTNIEFVIRNFDKLVNDDDDLVICTIGTNNRHQYKHTGDKKSREEYGTSFYENILLLNEKFVKRGKEYVLVANIPASSENERDKDDFWRILHMDDINEIYRRASEKAGFTFLSLYDLFSSYIRENGIELDSLLDDGLHPNDEGYRVMYKLICGAFGIEA